MFRFSSEAKALSKTKVNENRYENLPDLKKYDTWNYYSFFKAMNGDYLDQEAIDCMTKTVTYKELITLVDEIAKRLVIIGVKPGDLVMLLDMPTIESIAMILALGKIDATAYMIYPGTSNHSLAERIEKSKMRFAFIGEAFLGTSFKLHCLMETIVYSLPNDVYLDAKDRSHVDYKGTFPYVKKWEDFMAIEVSSGASDAFRPTYPLLICMSPDDGHEICLSHKSQIAAALTAKYSDQHMERNDSIMARIPLFAVSGSCMHGLTPLTIGVKLCCVPIYGKDDRVLAEQFVRQKPTIMVLSKASVMSSIKNPLLDDFDFSDLKLLYNIGKGLKVEEMSLASKFFMDRGSNTSIRSAYALPESGTVLTAEPASGEETSSSGYPLPYVSVYIVDPDSLEELLPGQLGEIIYSTPAQYDGYFDEGESRMIEGQDGRIYDRTGDLGLMDSDGNLTLIGRVEDRFVNDAGKKVYLTEMFTLLKSCKAFEDIKLVICDDDIVINYIENPMCEDTEDTLSELKRALIEAGFYKSQHTVLMKWDRFPEHGQLKALIKESADKELL